MSEITSQERLEAQVLALKQRQEAARIAKERVNKPVEQIGASVETDREERICGTCGNTFQALILKMNGRGVMGQAHCEPCTQKALNPKPVDNRAKEWESICPPAYRDTDQARLMRHWRSIGVQVDTKKILSTPVNRRLVLHGETDRGKTRLMFELVRIHHFNGIECLYVNGATFADKLAAQYADGAGAAERFMMRHINVPVLFYDDLGKEACNGQPRKMTDRAEEALYRLVEERGAHLRPILFTSNKTGKELVERMSLDRGEPILRRMRQMCETINL